MGNPVSSAEEHGKIDTAYKYRLPNGLLIVFLSLAIKRIQEPMKGQGGLVSRSALAALVQDSPP